MTIQSIVDLTGMDPKQRIKVGEPTRLTQVQAFCILGPYTKCKSNLTHNFEWTVHKVAGSWAGSRHPLKPLCCQQMYLLGWQS